MNDGLHTDDLEPFIRRLRHFGEWSRDEERTIRGLVKSIRDVRHGTSLRHRGAVANELFIVLDGLACRSRTLENGSRQIVALLIPGDPCDFQAFLTGQVDHDIQTITDCRIATIDRKAFDAMVDSNPEFTRRLWRSSLLDMSILREWLIGLGRRSARERTAHLIWELYLRFKIVGAADSKNFCLPLSQQVVADILGLSLVHMNKTLKRLRNEGLLEETRNQIIVKDPEGLRRVANFEADYLDLASVASNDKEAARAAS